MLSVGHLLMTGSLDKSAKLWDLNTGDCLRTKEHELPVTSVSLSSCGEKELINTLYKDVFLQTNQDSVESSGVKEIRTKHDISAISMSINGGYAITGSIDGVVKLIDLQQNTTLKDLYKHSGRVTAIDISKNMKQVLTGSSDNTAILWTVDYMLKGQKTYFLKHEEPISSVSISTDNKYVITSSIDGVARIWNMYGKGMHVFGHDDSITSVHANGRYVLTGSMDGTAVLWQVSGYDVHEHLDHSLFKTVKKIRQFNDGSFISSVTLTADNSLAVTAGRDGYVKIWEVESGKLLNTLIGHNEPITALAYNSCKSK